MKTSNRIPVFLLGQKPSSDLPQHSATKTLAFCVVDEFRSARWVGAIGTALQLTTCETWRQLKDRIKGGRIASYGHKVKTPKLLPPSRPINLDIAYPEKGRESARHPHQAFKDACFNVKLAQQAAKATAKSFHAPAPIIESTVGVI